MHRQHRDWLSASIRLVVVWGVVLVSAPPAAAQRSWDDSGNDASKEWSIFGNWNPDGTPAGEPITIGDLANAANDTTIVDQNFSIDSLTVSNGADVDTSGNELIVNGLTTIGGAGVNIFVDPRSGGDQDGLDSQGITVNNDAVLRVVGEVGSMAGGIVELESGQFQINPLGEVGGHGTIELIEAAAVGQVMENSGRLFVAGRPGGILGLVEPGTLTITNDDGGSATVGSGTLDLDGDGEEGVVDVDDGGIVLNSTSLTLVLDVPIADGFGGTMDIGNGDTVDVTNAWVIDGDGILNFNGTGTHTLDGGLLTVNGATTQVNLNAGTTVFQNNLTVTDGDFTLASGATVEFNGTTTFDDPTDFVNANAANTTIVVNAAVDIGLGVPAAGEDFNWDGGGFLTNGTTVNSAGDLDINVENIDLAGDSFGGTITMNSGNIDVQVADGAWIMEGVLNINNSSADVPLLSGDPVQVGNDSGTLDADINAGGTGTSQITAPITFMSDADVNVAAGATLVTGSATFQSVNAAQNAQFTGAGSWQLTGTNTVSEITTINMVGGTVDLDNSGVIALAANDTTVNAQLLINAATLANYGSSKTFGMITSQSDLNIDHQGAESGSLTVNLDDPAAEWTIISVGIVNLVNDNAVATLLAGSDVNMNGTLNVTGDVRTVARLDIGGTGIINILTAAEPFRLSGGNSTIDPNTIAGGTINGPGILGADNGRELSGFGTINADIDFDVASNLQADGGTLTINGSILDVGVVGTQDNDGILDVVSAWNSSVADFVDLIGGELRGGAITIDNPNGITGFGLVSAHVINNQRIRAQAPGQTLVVETVGNNNDWDGTTNTGELSAGSGNLEVRDNAAFLFRGTVSALNGRRVLASGFELEFEPASTLSLTGGTYSSTHPTDIGGTVSIGAGTSTLQIGGTTIFEAGSSTALIGDLRLDNSATRIQGGATFSGTGALINIAGRTLTLADGADVDVLLQNEGTLVLGVSPGQTQGLELGQTASGTWEVELGGTGLIDFDRMTLTGLASLDGTLDLSLIDGYVPSLLDPALTILSASSVLGTFSSVTQPAGMPAGLRFDVVYNAANVQLVVAAALLGDYNQNGEVDTADYVVWRDTLGNAVPPFSGADGDGDGTIDDDDYDVWTANFGDTSGSGSGARDQAAVPEPTSLVLALLVACGVGLMRAAPCSRPVKPRSRE
jgi:hypothetical protein